MKKENLQEVKNTEVVNEDVAVVSTATSNPLKKQSAFKRIWKNNWEGWMFTLPLFIGLAVFTVYPMIQSLVWSFQEMNTIDSFYFTGDLFVQYRKMFDGGLNSVLFMQVFKNTCFYTFLSVPISLVLSYLVAVLVNMKMSGIGAFRVLYYLPCVIPGVAASILWVTIFNYDAADLNQGIFNEILGWFGVYSKFFQSPDFAVAIGTIILMNLWSVGGGMILWLSAFKAIPTQLYEAAKIDGANKFRSFIHITIPMSMVMIFFNVVVMMIGTLQFNGTMIFGPSQGKGIGTSNSMYMFGVLIYNRAWGVAETQNIAYASALSWFLMLFIGAITAILFGVRRFLYMGDE